MPTELDVEEELFEDDLKPGTKLLHGQYVIQQFLSNGGFGITYLAKDSLNRLVVIKECFPEAICGRKNATVRVRSRGQVDAFRIMVDMFVNEARNLARLSHPNIVGVHQVFEDNDTAYMAMDFVEGRDLLEVVESSSAFKPEALEKIVEKLLDAIEFIHNEGMLHRDIAPDNILLGHDHEPVLIDFGAARETVSRATRLLGTMRTVKDGYSPHEFYVADAEQFPSSDLYSLAASLYHVMTKELPANAQDRLSAIAGGDEDPYVPIKTRVSGYSAPFLEAIDLALELFPKNRLQSAAEWREMIAQSPDHSGTRGAAARPVLAVDNTELARKIAAASKRPQAKYPARKMRPTSGQNLDMDSVFVQDDQAEVTPKRVRLSKGKGLYLAAATIAILACAGGAYLMGLGSNGAPPAVSAPDETLISEANEARPAVRTSDDGPSGAQAMIEAKPAEHKASPPSLAEKTPEQPMPDTSATNKAQPERPAWMDIGVTTDATAKFPASQASTSENAQTLDETQPNSADNAVVADDETNVIQEASAVLIGKAVRHQVLADPNDPTLIVSVDGPAAEHLEPGHRVLTINGFPITSWSDFQSVVDATREYSVGESVEVALGIEDPDTGKTSVKSVSFPAIGQVMLLNGVQFETSRDGDNWATVVTNGNGQAASDLQSGDQIIALMPSNELIDKEDTLSTLLMRELRSGTKQFNFAVKRGDDMWLVTMRYAAN